MVIGVAMPPGWIEFTRIPALPYSSAAVLVMPRTALKKLYSSPSPIILLDLITSSPCKFFISNLTAWSGPVTCKSSTCTKM